MSARHNIQNFAAQIHLVIEANTSGILNVKCRHVGGLSTRCSIGEVKIKPPDLLQESADDLIVNGSRLCQLASDVVLQQ